MAFSGLYQTLIGRAAGSALALALACAIACSTSSTEDVAGPVGTAVLPVDPNAPTVVYGDQGFLPGRLDIPAGQQVTFVNNSQKAIWPASNIHPTHEIYPEFQAPRAIEPGQSWTFKFDQAGFWRYHNHLSPDKAGLVVAEGDMAAATREPLAFEVPEGEFQDPPELSRKEYVDLFQDDEMLTRFTRRYGPAHTVELLEKAEEHIDVFCHDRAHDAGRVAYDLFGAVAFILASHECQAGAFHGATEALFRDRGTVNLTEDVETLCGSASVPFFYLQCLHGAGHGLMAWTSYELPDALELCDEFSGERDREACYSGVFMENVVGGLSGSMGHFTEYLSEDPHFPCNTIDDRYLSACYLYHSFRMLNLFEGDYAKVGAACGDAPTAAQYYCFRSLGRDVAAVTLGQPAKAIEMCGDSVSDVQGRSYCLAGAVQARFWGVEGAEEALSMCRMLDDPDEKGWCYWTIIVRATELYEAEPAFQGFCIQVEERFRPWCVREPS